MPQLGICSSGVFSYPNVPFKIDIVPEYGVHPGPDSRIHLKLSKLSTIKVDTFDTFVDNLTRLILKADRCPSQLC